MFKIFKTQKESKGMVYMIYSSLFLSLLNFSLKLSVGPVGFLDSAFLRYFSPLVVLVGYITWKKKWNELRVQSGFKMHFVRGLCAVIGQFFLSYYLTRKSVADATMLWATGPLYIPLMAHFLYKKKPPLLTWVSTIICLIGVAFVIKPTHGIFDPFSFWGILAGIMTAFSQLVWGYNVERSSVLQNMFYLYLFSSILAFLPASIFGISFEVMFSKQVLPVLTLVFPLMAITSLGNQLFRSKAYQHTPAYLLAPILYIAVIGAAALDIIFYHEWPDRWEYLGFSLVAVGTLIKWWYLKKISDHIENA